MNSRASKYRSVYAKDKQKQIDNSVTSQAVYLWLTGELGYRSRRSSSILEDVTSDKEITKEDVQKLCKNEFIPIFKFLMERVKSTKEVARIRKERLINQQQNVTLHHTKRSKAGSSTVMEDNFLRKAKLDKKLAQINTNTKNGEQKIEDLISRIAKIEFKARKVQEEIREKKNKIYMKETFRENCKSFATVENKYRYHLEEYRRKSGIIDEISIAQKGRETTMTIKIKNICEKFKLLGNNMILSKSLAGGSAKNQIQLLIEDLLKTSSLKLLLKSVSEVIRTASKDLTSCAEKFVDTTVKDSIYEVQKLLQQRRENQVVKFFETEAILNEIFKLKEKIRQETESIKVYIEKKYLSADDNIIQILNSRAALEANQAALDMIMKFANSLEIQQQNLLASGNDLSTLFNRVNGYNEVIEERQKNIQRLIYINQLTRMNFIKQSKEISSFVQEELFPFANNVETFGKNLDSMMMKENEKFKNLNLKLAKQVKLQSNYHTISTLDINRTLDDEFVHEVKDLIHCPKHAGADKIFMVLSDLKHEGVVFRIAHPHLVKNMKSCHNDLQMLAIRWLSAMGTVVTNLNQKISFMQTTDGMQQAAETLKDVLEKQEQISLSKEISYLKQEIDTICMAEDIFQEIQNILEERKKILSGQVGNRMIIQTKKNHIP